MGWLEEPWWAKRASIASSRAAEIRCAADNESGAATVTMRDASGAASGAATSGGGNASPLSGAEGIRKRHTGLAGASPVT
jgi:hypothetical protein